MINYRQDELIEKEEGSWEQKYAVSEMKKGDIITHSSDIKNRKRALLTTLYQ